MMQNDPPHDFPQLLRIERARLVTMLDALSKEDWSLPTPCPGWDVLALVHHLVGDDLATIAMHRDQHVGTPAPAMSDEAAFVDWLDRLQDDWVHAARRLSPRLAIELLDWLGDQVADTFATEDPEALTATVTWASDQPVPAWVDHARELTERWIHRQQLREALGRPTELDQDLAWPVLDTMRWAYPYRLDDAPPGSGAVEIRITQPFHRTWQLVRRGDTWLFDDEGTTPPAATMTMTGEQAWRLLSNNYRTVDHGPIELHGEPALLEILIRTRAIIGTPKAP